MPGCTAPNCTNSSKKGFRLFHFPSDQERCAVWIQNCGREMGWLPTRHTCLCEVHFEESQFESHRADGLRKLKPFAIPTLFNHTVPFRKKRKLISETEIAEQRTVLKEFMKLKGAPDDGDPSNRDGLPQTPKVKKSHTNANKPARKYTKSTAPRKTKYSKSTSKKSSSPVEQMEEAVLDLPEETNGCFICGCVMKKRIPLKIRSETSKIRLNQKLVQLVAQDFDLLVEDGDAICTICAKVLNCIDYVETVQSTLSKGILNRMKKKFGMIPTEETDILVYMKSLRNLHDFCTHEDMDGVQLSQKNDIESVTSKPMDCKQSQENLDRERINHANRTWETDESSHLSKPIKLKIKSNEFCKLANMGLLPELNETLNLDELNQSNQTLDLEESDQFTESLDPEESLSIVSDLEKSNQSSKALNLVDSNQSINILESEVIQSNKTLVKEELNQSNKSLKQEDNNNSSETMDLGCNNKSAEIDNVIGSEEKELKEPSTVEGYECQICAYKVEYKALMLFHLRQHFQELYSCDFCTNPVVLDSDQIERLDSLNSNIQLEDEEISRHILHENRGNANNTQSALSENHQTESKSESYESSVKEISSEKINEDLSGDNTPNLCNEGAFMTLTDENIPIKNKSVLVTFLPSVDMGEVTSLQNIARNEIEVQCKNSPRVKEEESGNSGLDFPSANNLPSDRNTSECDLATYSFLENYDSSVRDASTAENGRNIEDNL